MLAKSVQEITFARHAAQAMLRHALDNQPAICCGLLAGSEGHIQSAVAVPDASRILAELQKQPSQWMGVYRSSTNPDEIVTELDSTTFHVDGLLYLAVNMDTDGRLDTHAWQRHENSWHEVPLVLEEDATNL